MYRRGHQVNANKLSIQHINRISPNPNPILLFSLRCQLVSDLAFSYRAHILMILLLYNAIILLFLIMVWSRLIQLIFLRFSFPHANMLTIYTIDNLVRLCQIAQIGSYNSLEWENW